MAFQNPGDRKGGRVGKMKALLAGLITVVVAVSQAQAADAPSAPATTTSGWYYLEAGWYLMAPAPANHVAQAATANAQGFAAPTALPAGVTPARQIIAITAPTIRIPAGEPVDYPAHSGGSVWDAPTGNHSGSGDIGSMR